MLRVGKCGTCQAPQDSAGTFPAGSFGEFPISHAAVMRESRESCAALPKEEKRETERERERERTSASVRLKRAMPPRGILRLLRGSLEFFFNQMLGLVLGRNQASIMRRCA